MYTNKRRRRMRNETLLNLCRMLKMKNQGRKSLTEVENRGRIEKLIKQKKEE